MDRFINIFPFFLLVATIDHIKNNLSYDLKPAQLVIVFKLVY